MTFAQSIYVMTVTYFRHFILTVFLLFFSSLTLVPAALANDAKDLAFLEDLLDGTDDMPQNKKELLDQLQKDFFDGNTHLIEDLLLSTSSSVTSALTKALVNREDNENIAQLMEVLESNNATYLKFLSAVSNEIKKDPERLKRIEENLERLQAYYEFKPWDLPVYGNRAIQGTLIALGSIGMLYSGYDQMAEFAPHLMNNILQFGPYMLAGLGLSAIVGEMVTFKDTWRAYFNKTQRRRRAQRSTRSLRKLVNAIAKNPLIQERLEKVKYIGSIHAESSSTDFFQIATQNYLNEMQQLGQLGLLGELQQFYLSERFFKLMADFSDGLTEAEKADIVERAEGKDVEVPLWVDMKQLSFEAKVLMHFEQWMQDEERKTFADRYRRLLAQRSLDNEIVIDRSTPRAPFNIITTAISLGIAFGGVGLAVTVDPSLYYTEFLPSVSQIFYHHRDEVLITAGSGVVLSFGIQLANTIRRVLRSSDASYYFPIDQKYTLKLPDLVQKSHRAKGVIKGWCDWVLGSESEK